VTHPSSAEVGSTPIGARVAGGPDRRAELVLLIAVILGALLRLADLGGKSFWLDEVFSVILVRKPWAAFAHDLQTREANMSLYYLMLRPWVHLGGGEAAVRLLSAVPAIATIPLVYALGTRLFSRWAGAGAALVLALDPFHLGLSQDARSYSLAVFLVTCSMWAFIHVVDPNGTLEAGGAPERPGGGRRTIRTVAWSAGYVITSACAVYAHFYAAFVLLAQATALLRRPSHRTAWIRLIVCGCAVALLLIPLGLFLLHGQHTNIDWLASGIPADVSRLMRFFTTPLGLVTLVAGITAVIGLVWAGVQVGRSQTTSRYRWSYLLVILWLVTPIAIPLLVSITLKPVLEPRYAAVAIPALALLAGAIATQIRGARRSLVLLGVILTVEAFGDWAYFARFQKEDWRGVTRMLVAAAQPGDVVVFYAPYVRRPYDYYFDRFGRPARAPRVLYPPASYSGFDGGDQSNLSLSEAVARARRSAPRTWLVLSHAEPDSACRAALDAALRASYRTVALRTFPGIDVRLYSAAVDASVASVIGGAPESSDPTSRVVATECPQR
jgi:mannosyltransferase